MTGCAACGEQPKNTAKDFTKAVIEINNPEEIILFRKVVIPASMGDDTTVPAAIGKYRNVLLVYEANNHIYLYSSDGIPTRLASDGEPVDVPVFTLTDVDPGEGVPLEPNHFIAVYE